MSRTFRLAILNSHPIQYFAPLYRYLNQAPDIDVTVLYCSRQGLESYQDPGFGQVVQWDVPLLDGYCAKFLPNLRSQDRVAGFLSLINPSLVGELRRGRYDAFWVNGHMYFSYVLGILAANALRIPVLMRCETNLGLQRSRAKRSLRVPVMRLLYNHLCARCLAIGTLNRAFYQAHGMPDDRIFLVPYVVDNAFFMAASAQAAANVHSIRHEVGLPADRPLILYASKLIPRKRPMDLLQAYAAIRARGVDAALLFVGSGELEAALRGTVLEQHIPDVHFLGFRNQSELPRLYAAADIFVLPSEDEPWGLIINEAMCAGLPIVASREIGAVPDLVHHGDNGYTFPAGDVPQLAAHLGRLVGDPELRRQMGRRARERIQDWDFGACLAGLRAALQSLDR